MKVLRVLNDKLEEVFLVVLMAVATAIVFAQVVTRFILKTPLPWSEEIARFMFIWLIWVGAAFATKERAHIRIDFLVNRLPKMGQRLCLVLSTIVWLIFALFMIYVSLILTNSVMQGGQIGTGSGIPMWIPYAGIPVGMILMVFRMIQNIIIDFRALKKEKGGEADA
ncbi:MAG: TRAP transporter small permease [Firmicutes bacterium]|nr:TRAP transporter small permease [Bacillota bacterium]